MEPCIVAFFSSSYFQKKLEIKLVQRYFSTLKAFDVFKHNKDFSEEKKYAWTFFASIKID